MSKEIEYIIEESLSPDRYCLVHNYIVSLQQKVEQLEKELNQEKEEYAGLHKVLNNKEEEFEKENYNNVVEISRLKRKVKQLENIRKEAIDFVKEHARIDDEYPAYIEMLLEEKQDLLNILKNGDNKDVKKNNTNSN